MNEGFVKSPSERVGRGAGDGEDLEGIGPVPTIAWGPLLGQATTVAEQDVPGDLVDRRRAVRDLGRALRALGTASVMSEVPTKILCQARLLVAEATSILGATSRQAGVPSSVDDPYNGVRMFSPMTGEGSPFVAPLSFETVDGVASATCTFGEAFEGPPHHVHGGISAMLMDHALGHVVADSGKPGLTRKLVVQYLRPVPSGMELLVRGRVVASGDGDVFAQAWIAAAAEPGTRLVTADGHFRLLRPEQAAKLMKQFA